MSLNWDHGTAKVVATIFVWALMLSAAAPVGAAPAGGFLAVLNEQRDLGDSRNSVTFFDADVPGTPLFSVYVGREPGVPDEWEEPTALTVDPVTGDVYVVAFDDGSAGVENAQGDTQGDLDLFRINFAAIYQHWAGTFQGIDVRGMGLVTGPAPTGVGNETNLDYVTYANTLGDFHSSHSNQVALPGVIEKVGQVNRGNGGDGYPFVLEFITPTTLLLLDDSIGAGAVNDPDDDHALRYIERVSSSGGAASSVVFDRGGAGTNYLNGGYNGSGGQAATESWGSRVIQYAGALSGQPFLMQLDEADHSEPGSIAYYDDPLSGIRGTWISEKDSPSQGDAVGFVEFNSFGTTIGLRALIDFGHPLTFTISNDPAVEDHRGKVDNMFVDQDTGDLLLIESGLGDFEDGIGADHEPGVLRLPIQYDKGTGQIGIGEWQPKVFLNPAKDPGDTSLEHGGWSVYDSANDTIYFFAPGGSGETPAGELDIYALDLRTGLTTSYMNVDDNVHLFFGEGIGDKAAFFRLAPLPGDYNGDGAVNAADYTVWRNNLGVATALTNEEPTTTPGLVTIEDYFVWKNAYGSTLGSGATIDSAGAVPEPQSAVAFALGLLSIMQATRRRSRRALR
jgi:hypothetical protein